MGKDLDIFLKGSDPDQEYILLDNKDKSLDIPISPDPEEVWVRNSSNSVINRLRGDLERLYKANDGGNIDEIRWAMYKAKQTLEWME